MMEFIRLDKVVLNGLRVQQIQNMPELIRAGIVTVKSDSKWYLSTIDDANYSGIQIGKTMYFDKFSYSINNVGTVYCSLQISVNDSSVQNMKGFTMRQLQDRLKIIKEYLLLEYGILVDIAESNFKSMEIQRTIEIENTYDEYSRVIKLIMNRLFRKSRLCNRQDFFNTIHNKDCIRSDGTYIAGNKSKDKVVKIYNKSAQMRNVYDINIEPTYLRFEIRLKGMAIDKYFKTREVWKIADDDIVSYFISFIQTSIVEKYKKYESERDKYLLRILRDNYVPESHAWIREVVSKLKDDELQSDAPMLLDIEEIMPLIDKIIRGNPKVKYNAKMQFRKYCSKNAVYFQTQDNKKFNELIDKLIFKPI